MAERPTGTVTFLFTDIEGSTRLWEEHRAEMQVALERHDAILREAIGSHGGYVFSTAGDAFAAAFGRAADAAGAAMAAQAALAAEVWPEPVIIAVRMGLHTGEAQERDGDYFGPSVNRAARIMSAGHGGQILASVAVVSLAGPESLLDLGVHRLKDLTAAEHLWQIGIGQFAALRTLDAVRHNLPVERSALLGREREIEDLVGLVSRYRLVTLLGIGGTGKTRLASAVAAEVASSFGDGVWFVDLVPASDREGVAESIAASMGLSVAGTELAEALGELLDGREVLVLLDNCEHITDEVAEVVDSLLERSTGPRFLATSREPLLVLNERQIQVPPLEVTGDLGSPAVELFGSSAERVGFTIGPGHVPLVAEICSKLDGHPLSVELAAAQLRHLSLEELLDRLDQRFEILDRGRRGRGRQTSLIAVLDETWAMLDPIEAELLLTLGAFPSSFAVSDVEGIAQNLGTGAVARTLAGLVDLGLVASTGDGRHRLLETVKLFARQRWAEDSNSDRFLGRHTTWVLDVARARPIEDRYTSYGFAAWAMRHYDDHRSAEDYLAAGDRPEDLADLLSAMTFSYQMGSGPRASLVIDRIKTYLDELNLSDRARGLLGLTAGHAGFASRRHGWIERGSTDALRYLTEQTDPEHYAQALMHSTWITGVRDPENAQTALNRSVQIALRAGAEGIANGSLGYKAVWLGALGRVEESRRVLEELHARLEGRPFELGWNNYYVATAANELTNDPAAARQAARDVFEHLAEAFGTTGVTWNWWISDAIATGSTGDVEATRQRILETEEAVRNTSSDDGLPELLLPIIALAWSRDENERARRWITAVRHSTVPTSSPVTASMFRQLRDQLGLLADNPLDTNRIEDIYAETSGWLESL